MAEPFTVGFCVSGGGHLFRSAASLQGALGVRVGWIIADTGASADLEAFARGHGVASTRLPGGDREEARAALVAALRARPADLVCLTFDRIVPAEAIPPPGRMINVHMSLLPAFPGREALRRAIEAGVRFAGATVHEVTPEVDGGPIVAQCLAPVRAGDDAASLGARLYPLLRTTVLQVISWYAHGRVGRDARGRPVVAGAACGDGAISPAPDPELAALVAGGAAP